MSDMHGRIWTTDAICVECGYSDATLIDVGINNVITGQTVQCRHCDAYYDDVSLIVGASLVAGDDDATDAQP